MSSLGDAANDIPRLVREEDARPEEFGDESRHGSAGRRGSFSGRLGGASGSGGARPRSFAFHRVQTLRRATHQPVQVRQAAAVHADVLFWASRAMDSGVTSPHMDPIANLA